MVSQDNDLRDKATRNTLKSNYGILHEYLKLNEITIIKI